MSCEHGWAERLSNLRRRVYDDHGRGALDHVIGHAAQRPLPLE